MDKVFLIFFIIKTDLYKLCLISSVTSVFESLYCCVVVFFIIICVCVYLFP